MARNPPASAPLHHGGREYSPSLSETEVGDAPALLVHGQAPQPTADWCPVIYGLTGDTVTIGHSSDGCALLVVVDEQVFALTYGAVGRFTINTNRIDPIHRYAVEGWGEIVGQLAGNLTNERLTVTRGSVRPVSIAAARLAADRARYRPDQVDRRPARDRPGL